MTPPPDPAVGAGERAGVPGENGEVVPMSENCSDGAYPTGSTTVDSVTEQLTTRLGVVGESAGEVLRRKVRGAAGGAETIALLVGSDVDGARRVRAAGGDSHPAPAPLAGTATDTPPTAGGPAASPAAVPPPEVTYGDAADRPVAAASGAGDPNPPGPPPATPEPPSTPPSEPPTPPSPPSPEPAAPPSAASPEPPAPPSAPPSEPAASPSAPSAESGAAPEAPTGPSAAPVPAPESGSPAAAHAPPVTPQPDLAESRVADPAADPVPAAAGQTPWTAGQASAGTDPGTGQPSGSTPWNAAPGSSGSGSSMPYLPGMPGGLGSLTPQERPPRGSAPWSRGRAERNPEGTVFPRPLPEERTGRPR